MEPPWDGGTKFYSNDPGHMTKMATMPIYDKNFKKIFFSGIKGPMTLKLGMQGTKGPMTLKLGVQQWVHKYYHVCSNDDPC